MCAMRQPSANSRDLEYFFYKSSVHPSSGLGEQNLQALFARYILFIEDVERLKSLFHQD